MITGSFSKKHPGALFLWKLYFKTKRETISQRVAKCPPFSFLLIELKSDPTKFPD
jgi:hypothetical protein